MSTELEAARFVRAAMELVRDALPFGDVREHVTSYMVDMDAQVDARTPDAPPWTPERPERDLPWSDVVPGDSVLAPNGQWYEVDAWSRTGRTVAVLLKVGDGMVKSVRDAGERVKVRRGPTGQAADLFADAGFKLDTLEVVGS